MSTILKALKRLDEQRRADAAPRTLEEQVLGGGAPGEPQTGRPNKWLFVSGGAGVLLVACGVAWFATTRPAAPPAVAAAAPASQALPEPGISRRIRNAPRAALPASGAPIAGTQLDSALRRQLRPYAARGEAGLPVVRANLRPTRGNELEPEVADAEALVATPRSETPRFAVNAARDETPAAPVPAPAAPPAPKRVVQAEPPVEPDVAVVAHRPDVWVERTQWHPSPDKRSALVRIGENGELRELREGDAIDGVVVKEIRPSGVLFLHEGAEFKRGVGAS